MKPYITTYTGKYICPLNIKPEDIELEDIARGLSNTCRFGGQLEYFYSVAQHSVLCGELAKDLGYNDEEIMAARLHDFQESYLGDILKPIKNNFAISSLPNGEIISINEMEERIGKAFNKKFGLNLNFHSAKIKYVDSVLLNSESFYLRGFKITEDLPILVDRIIPLPPKEAYLQFIEVCNQMGLVTLTPENVDAAFSY